MFSQFVNTAKGFFQQQDSNEPSQTGPSSSRVSQGENTDSPTMVTATRRGNVGARTEEEVNPKSNGSMAMNGKRKSGPVNAEKADAQNSKRRKRTSIEAEEREEESSDEAPKGEEQQPPAKKNHVKFGSEEPEIPPELLETPATNQNEGEEESSDDDEAPETVDNSAQLSKMKSEAKKKEAARQIEEQLKKEKRKQLDQQRKLQAKSQNKKKEASAADDLLSESTETLQGSSTTDARRLALPALLPDDILNAAPAARPPTPPAEEFNFGHKKPNKLKFLDKKEKAPKDVKMGDVTIRVLDGKSKKKNLSALPPKASKAGRNSKQNWLNNGRSTGKTNGLRRTTGGPSGFVRR